MIQEYLFVGDEHKAEVEKYLADGILLHRNGRQYQRIRSAEHNQTSQNTHKLFPELTLPVFLIIGLYHIMLFVIQLAFPPFQKALFLFYKISKKKY